jgi:hypothetical protein
MADLVGALAPRHCWLLNATNSKSEHFPQLKLSAIYRRAPDFYTLGGASEGLNLLVQSADKRQNVLDNWLRTA